MAFNIRDFRSSFAKFEPAAPTNYEVTIFENTDLYQSESDNPFSGVSYGGTLKYRCEACTFPARNLVTSDRYVYGPVKKVVTGVQYPDVTFSFIVSDNMLEKEYFYRWQKFILDNDPAHYRGSANPELDAPKGNVSDVEYFDKYKGSVLISYFSKGGKYNRGDGASPPYNTESAKPAYEVVLHNAYPVSVQEVPLSWNLNNDYVRMTVVMAYEYFIEQAPRT